MAGKATETAEKNQLQKIFSKLTSGQKIIIGSTTVFAIILIVSVLFWATGVEYEVLYSNLTQKDAAAVVSKLQEAGIKYQLRGAGNMIYVPKEQVNELKLTMASEGLPEESETGYEIFDNNKLGMTDFMQRLNKKRALEGELSKSITSLRNISSSRVHIVIPKRALFQEDKDEPTASILLKLKGRSSYLDKKQINGIVNLVSNSVEGLKKNNISIIDSYGNQLNSQDDLGSVSGVTNSQYEIQKTIETNLQKRIQSLLNKILGNGKSVVRITADLNFEKVNRVMEEYDPEKQVLRSEERNENTDTQSKDANSTSESSVSNYEINKTVSTIISEVGNVKRLSIAVSVDGIYDKVKDEDGKTRVVYKPRSTEELTQLTGMVRSAVGFNSNRGDIIELVNIKFANDETFTTQQGLNDETVDLVKTILRYVIVFSLILIALFVFRSLVVRSKDFAKDIWPKLLSNKISGRIVTADGEVIDSNDLLKKEEDLLKELQSEPELQNIEDNIPEDVRLRTEKQNQIKDFVMNYSDDATSLLKSWLYENGELNEE